MELIRWEPFNGLYRINEFFDEAFGRQRTYPALSAANQWYPPVDILESKDAYLIRDRAAWNEEGGYQSRG